jgi:hypothetical protein
LLQSDLGTLASKVSDMTKAKIADATSEIQHQASQTCLCASVRSQCHAIDSPARSVSGA